MSATHYTKIAPTARLNPRAACGRRSVTMGAMTSPLITTQNWERVTCKACLDKKPAPAPTCAVRNGSYPCDRPVGHDGHHRGVVRVRGERIVFAFADSFSSVRATVNLDATPTPAAR
jgi:hypothetical protein